MKIPNSRESSAYDLSLFEEREERERKTKTEPEIQMVKNPSSVAKRGNIFKILVIAFLAAALPFWIIYHKAESSELSRNISNANIALEEAQSENLRLQAELDNLVTLARVEEFAQNELGMRKITSTQGTHITIDTGGVTEIAAPEDFMSNWFSNIVEFFSFR
jgi:cell division protein FtsL